MTTAYVDALIGAIAVALENDPAAGLVFCRCPECAGQIEIHTQEKEVTHTLPLCPEFARYLEDYTW
jgi:hypothetical protein